MFSYNVCYVLVKQIPKPHNIMKTILYELIGTAFYIGKIKVAPGTFGSLVAIPLILFFNGKWPGIAITATITFIIGLLSANHFIKLKNTPDPPEVVIDEILGFFISYIFVTPTLKNIVIGFLIFRILDIIKPFPINICDKLPQGYGVMIDDLVAGLINAFILYLIF